MRAARLVIGRGRLANFVLADSFLHHMVRNLVGSLAEVDGVLEPRAGLVKLLPVEIGGSPGSPGRPRVLARVMHGKPP